jgi:hypothetical protein
VSTSVELQDLFARREADSLVLTSESRDEETGTPLGFPGHGREPFRRADPIHGVLRHRPSGGVNHPVQGFTLSTCCSRPARMARTHA